MLSQMLRRLFGTLPESHPAPDSLLSSQIEQPPPAKVPTTLAPSAPAYAINPPAEDIADPNLRAVYESYLTYAHVINESLQIANGSKNPGTKVSRLLVARQKLDELKALIARSSKVHIVNLDAVEQTITDLDDEFIEAGYYAPDVPATNTSAPTGILSGHIGQLSPTDVASALGADDVIVGSVFFATHQLRTPLRVLSRHGEVHRDMHCPPPIIAMAPFEGIWLPLTKTYRELGIDMDELPWTVASDIGPVLSHDYLPFLVAMRSIVEGEGTATARRDRLIDELRRPIWDDARNRSGGAYTVADHFFPQFVATIQGLPRAAASVLTAKGLRTAASLARASDAELLAIKGIGPAKLKLLRAACVAATEQDEEWRDLVLR